ncbi:hypothetical protein ACF1AL_14915 [Streptomyces sp. NPDC014801]|uniref:hypothetical protein n=1 Tax=Streptomyces sp. NPDC014801 TaxID=3364916 RepID=UPI0036FE9A58
MTTRTATKPDDQPFDFNLDTVKAESDLAPWRVHWDGRRWEFRHAEELDVWGLAEGAEAGDIGATMAIFRLALGDEQWADFRKIKLPQYKMKALFEGYKKYCGLGESEASPAS